MENALWDFLLKNEYKKIKLKLTKTNHLEVKATINGVKGLFILDTGASSSCIGFEDIELFNLNAKASNIKAAGAGATDMFTQTATNNSIKIGRWKNTNITLVLFDLTHVNTALITHNAKPVNGIIGADILKKGRAIIDYNKKYLYLKS
ncbi:retropepsin-like aspartic protease [Lacinutrix jangbogonensis]|uniref:retropepsin-like aspartic protease n=1 Tax=Lacinutrix jangbogonensis TaxID=1469557 RepID=UPI00053DBAD7|nr:retropepsin-like aspartic protease [Lacinutrix jangbogonensis]